MHSQLMCQGHIKGISCICGRPSGAHMPALYGGGRPASSSQLAKPPEDWRDTLLAPPATDWLLSLLDGCRARPEPPLASAARHLLVPLLPQPAFVGLGTLLAGALLSCLLSECALL